MAKKFKSEDVPADVMFVWAIQWSRTPVGTDVYDRIQKIIDKHPQYFEWEHKYKSIPKEVHEAFQRECYPERYEPIVPIEKGDLIPVTINTFEVKVDLTVKDLFKIFQDYDNWCNKKEQERIAYERKVRAIWDKHYKKFGLECREIF